MNYRTPVPVYVVGIGCELGFEHPVEGLFRNGLGYFFDDLQIGGDAVRLQVLFAFFKNGGRIDDGTFKRRHGRHQVALARRARGRGNAVDADFTDVRVFADHLFDVVGLDEIAGAAQLAASAVIEIIPAGFVPVDHVAGAQPAAPGLSLDASGLPR